MGQRRNFKIYKTTREAYSNKPLHKKKESYQINKLNLYLKKLKKEEEKKLRDSRWKETTAIRADTGQQNNRIKQNEKLFF